MWVVGYGARRRECEYDVDMDVVSTHRRALKKWSDFVDVDNTRSCIDIFRHVFFCLKGKKWILYHFNVNSTAKTTRFNRTEHKFWMIKTKALFNILKESFVSFLRQGLSRAQDTRKETRPK